MSFSISVHRQSDGREVYTNPLGAGHIVHQFWHAPAAELGLPLLGSLYNEGVTATGAELSQLESELSTLEARWAELQLDLEPPLHWTAGEQSGTIAMRTHLQQRAGYLKEAIQIARKEDGVLELG